MNHLRVGKFLVLTAAAAMMLCACSSKSENPSTGTPAPSPGDQTNLTVPKPADKAPGEITTEQAKSQPAPDPLKSAPQRVSVQAPDSATAMTIDHVVVVVEENHSYNQIIGNKQAPYFNQLIADGALFTNSHGITHPSQPNYLALFSGSTQQVKDDSCGKLLPGANLASELIQRKLTFAGYSEDLPKAGYQGCSSGGYARKHNPWVQFSNLPAELNQPYTSFPQDYGRLPTVSFIVPNHQDDMHDGTVGQADSWLKDHLKSYVDWAKSNRSLLIVTWDEDDNSKSNRIPTIFVGPMVKQGKYDESVNHYNVLRTIEDIYKLPPLGESAKATSLTRVLS